MRISCCCASFATAQIRIEPPPPAWAPHIMQTRWHGDTSPPPHTPHRTPRRARVIFAQTLILRALASCLSQMASKRVLAGCLGISAGVMLYVSFVEIFVKSLGAFEEAGNGPSDAYLKVRSRRDRRDRGTSPGRDIAAPTPKTRVSARARRVATLGFADGPRHRRGRPSFRRTPRHPSHTPSRALTRLAMLSPRARAPRDDDRRRSASSAAAS